MRARRFAPLFWTQALGALNDNMFKNALVVLALFRLAHLGPVVVALSGGVFLLPYALFSATAGQIADAGEKSRLIRWVKFWELGLMALASWGFLSGNFAVLLAVLFGLGVQAAFFSPLKYGILPDHLAGEELVAGNGLVEAGTFTGILLGTVLGGVLLLRPDGAMAASGACLGVAALGILAAYRIPMAPSAQPQLRPGWNFAAETWALVRLARENAPVWFAIYGISWFWAVGATLLAAFPTLARQVLHADGHVVTLMLAVFAVGVGIGSLAVARFVKDASLLAYVAAAGAGVSVFTADFAFTALRAGKLGTVAAVLGGFAGWHMLADLLLLAVCGGTFSVPLYVLLQERSAASHRARMVGANNVMNALASVLAAGITALLYARGVGAPAVLLGGAAGNALVTWWIFRVVRSGVHQGSPAPS
ncbi:MFS transporter [Acidocella sp.]|uniref:MFS transporter n=1 Tax=Acidocella sp. TaxID=50710 RepID=UPI00262C6E19|nr:MFS transporter [Acidocella sp.]MDD2794251.1 MFS transporter [Acidocella sp.]